MSSLSVIIPTCGREKQLASALSSLAEQSVGLIEEVVVVADGPVPPQISGDYSGLKIRCFSTGTRKGPGAARNMGALAAKSPILLFIDDDICLEATGAAKIVEAFERAETSIAISGKVLPAPDLEDNCYMRFAYGGAAHSKTGGRGVRVYEHFCSSLMAVSRDIFLDCRGFNEDLLRYEDSELAYRMQSNRVGLFFMDELKSCHLKQMDRDWFVGRCSLIGVYLKMFREIHPSSKTMSEAVFCRPCFAAPFDWLARRLVKRLPLIERLPMGLDIALLRLMNFLSSRAAYVFGERSYSA